MCFQLLAHTVSSEINIRSLNSEGSAFKETLLITEKPDHWEPDCRTSLRPANEWRHGPLRAKRVSTPQTQPYWRKSTENRRRPGALPRKQQFPMKPQISGAVLWQTVLLEPRLWRVKQSTGCLHHLTVSITRDGTQVLEGAVVQDFTHSMGYISDGLQSSSIWVAVSSIMHKKVPCVCVGQI